MKKSSGNEKNTKKPRVKFSPEIPELPLNKLGPLQNLMTGGNYHCGDYSFFYFNIRENVKERVKAYFNNTQ